MPRKICVVVTARPSYSRIKSALQAIQDHPDLELLLVVAGSALLGRYGTAVKYIEEDGFEIAAKVFNVLEGGNLAAQSKTTGLGIIELTNVFENLKPDAVVTVADRFETMSTAIAASYLNIPLVHVQGGEVTGNIDEKVRHAVTKLADIHFVSSQKAKERVIKMGEAKTKVFHTGCPSIDLAKEISNNVHLNFDPYLKYGGVGAKPNYSNGYLIVMQHPVTTEYEQSRKQALETLETIHELQTPCFWFWPNVDAGSDGTSNAIRSFRENNELTFIHFFKNMKPHDFLIFLKNSVCLVGNSSVGIRECAYLGVPVVNIGTRQNGRERADNVIDVNYRKEEIRSAILQQVEHGKYNSADIYGNGNAG
ncbi:MAG TPA: UDP-N-acetylglucosamine 2-epimerase (hydrolyzing), partial [Bacteroidetes bacterium]|nr:UDP-N-acetylglucosamine 2-epimerase (hydrolyzing) [Bacteroidota bacterium]